MKIGSSGERTLRRFLEPDGVFLPEYQSQSSTESSRPRELPPQSLTQPDVNLSVHPAPIDQPIVVPVASAQTDKASVLQCAQASKKPCVCDGVTFCTSAWPIVAMRR